MAGRAAYCGIDVGTQGVRCAVVDEGGEVLATGSAPLRSDRPGDGRHEQDPASWWDALVKATRSATDAAREAAPDAEVRAAALDGTSGTVLVEDGRGESRGPALMYDDARAADLAEEVQRAGQHLWSELGYRIQPTWALPRALWLARRGDLAPGSRIVHQTDHLVGRLLGAPAPTDTSTALKTGVDLLSAGWPTEVHHALGLDTGLLPEVVLPGTEVGTVSPEAARSTGLPVGAVVRAGLSDGCASQVASGALAPGSWSSTLGTTLVVKGSVAELVRDPTGAVYCHRHPDGGWLPGGASSSGTAVLAAVLPGADLDDLTRRLQGRPDPERAAYPLAGTGERFPFVSAEAHRVGLPVDADDLDAFAALCLGIAFVERLAYDALGGLGADVSGPVALTGGGTRNPWLNQLRTDVLGRPTRLPAAAEASVGMAVVAAAPPGALSATAERMVTVRERLEPDPERGRSLAPAYHAFVTDLVERGWLDPDRAAPALEQHDHRTGEVA